ncbi:MAG TPA: ATP-dependent helicase C-terminal domain-containing protein [Vicinamibacterales bacterium]
MADRSLIPLPIDSYIDHIVQEVRQARAAIVTAAPGAGKTTRVPPALLADGPVILLQPRRVAARAMAARIANERGWTLGSEVGWQVRFERRFTAATRLLVVTEGVLTARLQADPLLSEFNTIILDEFHERSVHADLALALARQAWRARVPPTSSRSSVASSRDDLRIVVMSATIESGPVSAFLDGCPVIDVPGRMHPIEVRYTPEDSVAEASSGALAATTGNVLCFLPGAPEIRRAVNDLQTRLNRDVEIVPLHGSLDAEAQDLALRPSTRRRVIVATNIAETSLTVPGVTAVIDSGLHKVARYDSDRGIDSLDTERITADAADQRAGRAGRLAAGIVWRLWDSRDRLRPHREPEIHRIDLASTVLDVIAWGGDPRTLEWFDRPSDEAIDAALTLLRRLALVDGVATELAPPGAGSPGVPIRLTAIGERVRRLPLHPRLGRMLVTSNGARSIAQACALLSERHLMPARTASTTSDLLSAIDDWRNVPSHVQRVAEQIVRSLDLKPSPGFHEADFRRAVLSGYPDRVAQRREAGSASVRLASGTGATIASESGVREGEFLVALDVSQRSADVGVRASATRSAHVPRGAGGGAGVQAVDLPRIRLASLVDRDWLEPTSSEIVHRFDRQAGHVRALRVNRYDALVLGEHHVTPDPELAAQLLADAWIERGPGPDDARLLRRLRFAGRTVDLASLLRAAAYGARALDDVKLESGLGADVMRALEREAPETLLVPSGRTTRLDYNEDGTVTASVKLQELFGLAETPQVGARREPVVLSLLAPNGRPVQVTRDLRSFWDRTYPEVRKELRGRYPKHRWPEDPWRAQPTARTTTRRK